MVTPHTFLLSITLALGLGDAAIASSPELLRIDAAGSVVVVDGWLGVMLDTQADAATIAEVIPGSPAAKAGVKAGDVVLAVDDQKIANATGLIAAVRGRDVGSTVRLRLRRGEATMNLSVTLGERPADTALQSTPPQGAARDGRPARPASESKPQGAPYVGVRLDESNLEVLDVVAGGPAAKAGIKKGDIVQAAGGRPLNTLAALDQMMRRARPGMTVTVRLKRGDGSIEKRLTFGSKPTADAAAQPQKAPQQKDKPAASKTQAASAKKPAGGGAATAKASATSGKAFAGVRLDESNLTILDVYPGGPAAKAGLQKGDVVQAAGGRRLNSLEALDQMMQRAKPGMAVTVRVRRGDQTMDKRLTFGSMPSQLGGGQPQAAAEGRPAVAKPKAAPKAKAAKAKSNPAKAPKATPGAKPWVGVRIDEESLELLDVTKGGPAAAAGLRKGDILQAAGGRRIGNLKALDAMLERARPGMVVTVRVRRGNETLDRKMTIGTRGSGGKRPAPSVAASRPATLQTRNVARGAKAAPAKSAAATTPATLAFVTNWRGGQEQAKKAGKPMFVMFGASWCSTCKAQKKAFASSGVASALGGYVPVYVDTDKEGKLADRFGVVELPHLAVVTAAGKTVQKHAGFLPAARLQAFLSQGAARKTTTKTETTTRTARAQATKQASAKRTAARKAAGQKRKVAAAKRAAARQAAAAKRAAARAQAAKKGGSARTRAASPRAGSPRVASGTNTRRARSPAATSARTTTKKAVAGRAASRRPAGRVVSGRAARAAGAGRTIARRVAPGNGAGQMREIAGLRREVAELRKEIAALRAMVRELNAPRRRR